jgi:hypothetical protein
MVCGYAVLQNIWAYLRITWLKIEMWGVYEGLLMAVVHSITDDNVGSSMVRSILQKIKCLLSLDWNVCFIAIYRVALAIDVPTNVDDNVRSLIA